MTPTQQLLRDSLEVLLATKAWPLGDLTQEQIKDALQVGLANYQKERNMVPPGERDAAGAREAVGLKRRIRVAIQRLGGQPAG